MPTRWRPGAARCCRTLGLRPSSRRPGCRGTCRSAAGPWSSTAADGASRAADSAVGRRGRLPVFALFRGVDDLPDPALEAGGGEVARDGIEFAISILTDALHESRPHRVRGVEDEGTAQLPQLPPWHRRRHQDLPVEEVQREVSLDELAAQPLDGPAPIHVTAEGCSTEPRARNLGPGILDGEVQVLDDRVLDRLAPWARGRAGAHPHRA